MRQNGRRETILFWLLRLGALTTMSAFATVLLPVEWMAAVHEKLGMGRFPDAPISAYMARSLSLFYGFHGVLMWIVSTDLRRYRPLIGYLAWMLVVIGPGMLVIDLQAGLPLFWTLSEGPPLTLLGLLMLYLRRSVPLREAHD